MNYLNHFKHYAKVYREFVSTSITQETSFRINLVMIIIMDIFFYASSLLSVDFIYDHVQTIGPWSRPHLLFFLSFMLSIDGIHMSMLSTNFWLLADDLKTGNLDFTLTRPISPLFIIFLRYFRPSGVISMWIPFGALIYYGSKIHLSYIDWCLIPIFLLLGLILLTLIEMVISAAMFWTIEGIGINFLRMQFQQLSRWPNFIYKPFAQRILTVFIPILLVGSAPTHYLFNRDNWSYLIMLLVSIFVFGFIVKWLWRHAFSKYESASS